MRRFCDYEPGDAFSYRGAEFMRTADGAIAADPLGANVSPAGITPGQWLCEV